MILNNPVAPLDPTSEKGLWRIKKDKPGSSRKKQMKKSKWTKQPHEELAIGGKDASLFLFRALGKILHCKRKSFFPFFFLAAIFTILCKKWNINAILLQCTVFYCSKILDVNKAAMAKTQAPHELCHT